MKEGDLDLPALARHPNGDVHMSFTSGHIKQWLRNGLIPPGLAKAFQENLDRSKSRSEKIKRFWQENSEASDEDLATFLGIPQILSEEESAKMRRDAQNAIELQDFMVQNWNLLVSTISEKGKKNLFRGVLQPHQFGVPRIESDPLYRWRDLLDAMEVKYLDDNNYRARGEIKRSNGFSVILEYDFRATGYIAADKTLEDYKAMMSGKGLRAFLAYWYVANEKGGVTFSCSISDVMDLIASESRKSYQIDKHREEFWRITRTLAATKLKVEWPKNPEHQQQKQREPKKKPKIMWIEQPLLQIHGGECAKGEDCPISVKITVLTKESGETHFAPALYSRETLRLHPSDVLFATIIQARAAQGPKEITMDWDFAFRFANVNGIKSNCRVAKAKVRKKLDRFRKKAIIHQWTDDKDGVQIQPQKVSKSKQT